MEMDNEVGNIIQELTKANEMENTLILVTGDNGPWECKCHLAGSAGPFQGRWLKNNGGGSTSKMTIWEGGHRVVGLAHWPSTITPGVSNALVSSLRLLFLAFAIASSTQRTHRQHGAVVVPSWCRHGVVMVQVSSLDYFPTIAAIAGLTVPGDRSFDGIDLSPLLRNQTGAALILPDPSQSLTSPGEAGAAGGHSTLFHPLSGGCGSGLLKAARLGKYKAMWLYGGTAACGDVITTCHYRDQNAPLLFDLSLDPAEANALNTTDPKYKASAQNKRPQGLGLQCVFVSLISLLVYVSLPTLGRTAIQTCHVAV